jgi:UDP-N-acetylglucosamine 4,6-dehydratase
MRDKVILVTGGCGSFGKEFVKTILATGPKQIRVFSRDEYKQAEMKAELNDPRVEYLCGDVRDAERLNMALEGVDVCVHAAAMKRIEKCELDPEEAIKSNVIGSMNVAKACLKNNVTHSVLISTDKASEPVNLYGATKMAAEKAWIRSNVYRGSLHPTKFSVVRYGNVVGSRGSVVPMFKKQAEEDGVIRVTHRDMTRFFITLQQAVALVQIAVEYSQGGEIYLPALKSASIVDLARAVDSKAHIVYTTPSAGEKLHEQLLNRAELSRVTIEDGYTVVHPEDVTWPYQFPAEYSGVVPRTSFDSDKFTFQELKVLVNEI